MTDDGLNLGTLGKWFIIFFAIYGVVKVLSYVLV